MRITRIVSTIVTGSIMVLGGVALCAADSPALVTLLGAVTALVGVGYGYAGVRVEWHTAPQARHSRHVQGSSHHVHWRRFTRGPAFDR